MQRRSSWSQKATPDVAGGELTSQSKGMDAVIASSAATGQRLAQRSSSSKRSPGKQGGRCVAPCNTSSHRVSQTLSGTAVRGIALCEPDVVRAFATTSKSLRERLRGVVQHVVTHCLRVALGCKLRRRQCRGCGLQRTQLEVRRRGSRAQRVPLCRKCQKRLLRKPRHAHDGVFNFRNERNGYVLRDI